jgi:hypothetical protein
VQLGLGTVLWKRAQRGAARTWRYTPTVKQCRICPAILAPTEPPSEVGRGRKFDDIWEARRPAVLGAQLCRRPLLKEPSPQLVGVRRCALCWWCYGTSRDAEQAEDCATRVEGLLELGRHELLGQGDTVGHVGQQGHSTLAEGRLPIDGHGHVE